jgi:hypothetical protein
MSNRPIERKPALITNAALTQLVGTIKPPPMLDLTQLTQGHTEISRKDKQTIKDLIDGYRNGRTTVPCSSSRPQ